VWLLPERARDYARALLETIDFLTPASDVPLLASGFGRASTLKRRFDMILRQRASHRLSWPARAGVAAASLLILPWSLTTLSADDNPPSATNPTNPPVTPSAGLPPAAESAPTADATPRLPTPAAPVATNDAWAAPPGATPVLPPTAPRSGTPSEGLTPPATTPPVGAPVLTPASPPANLPRTVPRAAPATSYAEDTTNASVNARLERLEATTAELLILVKQLRAEQQGTTPQPTRATGGAPWPPLFGLRYGHRDRQLDIEVNGAQIAATDVASQKKLWVASMPFTVRSVQGQQGKLLAVGSDGTTALIDPDSGKIEAANKLSNDSHDTPPASTQPIIPMPARTKAVSPYRPTSQIDAEKRAEQVAKIEIDMLETERRLATERAELQHEVRRLETRKARAARKVDALNAGDTPEDHAKVIAELEDAEDQLIGMQHKVDTFETDLEFKIRELQIRRNQMLRIANPFSAPNDDSSQTRSTLQTR
jgi:hypothetical protein